MKWFKHMTNASGDEFVSELEALFGWEGYGRWWKLLEIIGGQMDKTGKCSASYSWVEWQRFLKGKRNKLDSFLVHCQNKGKIKLESNSDILKITCLKLLEFRDEYSRKSGQTPEPTPDKVAPDIRRKKEEVEKNSKQVSKPPVVPQGGRSDNGSLFEVEKSTAPNRFSEFYSLYPKKRDRAAAEKAYSRAIEKTAQETIIRGARLYAAECAEDTRPDAGKFFKNPSTWLNGSCWENYDDVEEVDLESLSENDRVAHILRLAGEQ